MSDADAPRDIDDYERAARQILPRHVYDHIADGAYDEVVLRRNRTAFERLALRPRYMRDVRVRDLSTTVLNDPISMPVFASSAGNKAVVHPDGDVEVGRAAAAARTLMVVPARTPEAIAAVGAAGSVPLWLQVTHTSRDYTEELVRAAERAGYRAICPVVDVPVVHLMERDMALVRHGLATAPGQTQGKEPTTVFQFTLDDLEWLRGITRLPIVLKGITHPEDARLAVEGGAAGVFVSNHGARWNDATMSSLECLEEVAKAVGDRAEVYLDSGVRRGSDVLKALALGARAVGVGRALFWGLAAGGARGVEEIFEVFRRELDVAVAYTGLRSVRDAAHDALDIPADWGSRGARAART